MSASRRLTPVISLVTAAVSSAVFADTPVVLEQVVVTATKRAESIQDVPVAVSAITSEDIATHGFTQYADLLNTLPGVYFQDAGPGVSQVRIRGVSASEGGVPSTTASYFGEAVTSVLTNKGGKPNLRLVDIDRVEVLRGPQGTLFGANSLAGVLRTIPKAPNPEQFEASIGTRGFTTAHSSDESYHVEGVVNIPLVRDRLALRVVGYKDDIAGYVDNVSPAQASVDYSGALGLPDGMLVTPAIPAFTHKDINSEDTWGARTSLQWRVTDRLRFDLGYTVQDDQLNSEPHADPTIGEYEQRRPLDQFEHGGYGERINITSGVVSYDWDTASLVSASNWMRMNRFSNSDITFLAEGAFGAPIPWGLNDRSIGRLFTQEVRLQSRGESPLQWIVGLYYLSQKADFSQFVPDFSCPACLPQLLAGQDFGLSAPLSRFSEQKQRSVFGEISYAFTPQWTVGVGGRYLRDEVTAIGQPVEGILVGGLMPADPTRSGTNNESNPSAYVRFKPTDNNTLYVQAARGFRSGQVNPFLPDQCQDEARAAGEQLISDPDTLWNYELGWKALFDEGRYSLNTAVYRQNWKGVQLIKQFVCGFSGILNGGDVKGRGAEVEFVAQPNETWRFNLSASYNRNRFEDVIEGTDFHSGERLPDAPETQASAGAQYNFGLGADWTGFLRADYAHIGNVQSKFSDTLVIVQDAFDTVNLRLAFQRDDLQLELFGRNITDERGVLTTTQPQFGGYQTLIRPREIGVELRYSFH
jgi:outer membrane receptor protein involved in Fe transport